MLVQIELYLTLKMILVAELSVYKQINCPVEGSQVVVCWLLVKATLIVVEEAVLWQS